MAKPNKNELKRAKDLAETLLKAQGIDHDEWLYEQYIKIQSESADIIENAMKLYLSHQNQETQPFIANQLANEEN
ncbi:hypothetical protein C672_3549 [[Clostridium] bifermentans ATCC 638]|uniref:Uncharacterized protein n=3 Tax=Paraclostridium bifermentans TaxID=1490 RepID=T4V8C2_PARBF|nr:hypothetical protein [Paraclostridium bifermentans]EQK39974.1 hypothetical protein C672_3549 [[Clostridium] bifermentans ATCC 638] [Paraclostridium bifermentans ATCC 638 = DSM 14991]QEZ70794.1 hypothetical protein D4A35_17810 [Paraclostridium bifermentans]